LIAGVAGGLRNQKMTNPGYTPGGQAAACGGATRQPKQNGMAAGTGRWKEFNLIFFCIFPQSCAQQNMFSF